MPVAALVIGVIAVETGAALAIGTAIAGATVSAATAVAIGSGVVSAGVSLAQGASISDVLKNAVIGGVVSFAGGAIAGEVTSSISAAATDAGFTSMAGNIGKVAGAMAGGATTSAIGAGLSGRDPIDALIKGGLTAGLSAGATLGANAITSEIPGFNDLAKDYGAVGAATQRAITAGLTSGMLGKDIDKSVVNSVLGSMMREGGNYVKEGIKDSSAFLKSTSDNVARAGEALEDNNKRQQEFATQYQSTVDDIEAKRQTIQANLDIYNAKKTEYDNWSNVEDSEGRNVALAAANDAAKLVNDAVPIYEVERVTAEEKLNGLSTELDTLKAQTPALTETLNTEKTALDTSVKDFQTQEEANAQFFAKTFNDTLATQTSNAQTPDVLPGQEQFNISAAPPDINTDIFGAPQNQGVQVAAYQPPFSGVMSDAGGEGDVGLRSLVSPQRVNTVEGLASLNDTTTPDLVATTQGTATNSALTDQDPTKTITGSILDSKADDVRAGVQSGALYSGANDEIGTSGAITAKYLNEPTGNTQQINSGDTMSNEYEGILDDYGNPLGQSDSAPNNGYGPLGLPPGAESDPVAKPDFDGALRNLGNNSQEFMTENGKVIYYDDGRVETIGNDGRYVMYGADGSVVDYANINNPNGKVQTYAPGARGEPSGVYNGGSKFDKFISAAGAKFAEPKTLAALGGAALGVLAKPKGMRPMGLRALPAGAGTQKVQTGAKGTGGKGSVRYFEKKATGGAIKEGLGYLKSAHDGMEDKINASIDNKRPAKLSGGEFVIPADVVSHLGNGNSEAGAKQLYALMERVRKARTGTAAQGKQIDPKKYLA